MTDPVARRVVVVPLVRGEDGSILLCKMPPDRGVFPGQWALPGGGVEEGETLREALAREIREELGVGLVSARPAWFSDLVHDKTFPGGRRVPVSMVFEIYECTVDSREVTPNEEFTETAWVAPESLGSWDLNDATRATLRDLGILPAPESDRRDAASEIRRRTAAFQKAYAEGDLLALHDYYADDVVKLRHGAPAEGKREMLSRLESVLAEHRGAVDVDLHEVTVHGDLAVVRGSFTVTLTPRAGGEPRRAHRRFVEVWRRDGGAWRVSHAIDNSESPI